MDGLLQSAYLQFWSKILNIWKRTTSILYTEMLMNEGYFVTNFSSSTGLYIFQNGECYPHWPTLETSSITSRISTEKACLPVRDLSSSNNNYTLPSIPYYNLCLQDMKCRSSDADKYSIQISDKVGWNGTSSIQFLSQRSEGSQSSSFDIPLYLKVNSTKHLLTVRIRYMSNLPCYHFHLNFEMQFKRCSGGVERISNCLSQNYILMKHQDDVRIVEQLDGEERNIKSTTETLVRAQSTPAYYWADETAIEVNTYSIEGEWVQTSFQIEIDKSVQSEDCFIALTGCRMHLDVTDFSNSENMGFILGSFEVFSGASISDYDINNIIESSGFKVEECCACIDDERCS